MIDIQRGVVEFIDRRELIVAREAVKALGDAVNLKAEIGLPVLAETRDAILELESEITSLKLALLRRNSPDQMELPMDLPSTKEGEQKANAAPSCPVQMSDALGS